MASKKALSSFVVVAILVAAVLFLVLAPSGKSGPNSDEASFEGSSRIADAARARTRTAGSEAAAEEGGEAEADDDSGECEASGDAAEGKTEEEKLADAEEAAVDAFDDLTDKFRDVEEGREISMDEVKKFHEQFKKVPKSRKEECLQRALNLVPDENIMLLAGILMDKEEDKELVELVFNDVLNRDDEMKQVLLNQIYKDKSHPCWADAAWILDVTGKVDAGSGETVKDEAGKDGE